MQSFQHQNTILQFFTIQCVSKCPTVYIPKAIRSSSPRHLLSFVSCKEEGDTVFRLQRLRKIFLMAIAVKARTTSLRNSHAHRGKCKSAVILQPQWYVRHTSCTFATHWRVLKQFRCCSVVFIHNTYVLLYAMEWLHLNIGIVQRSYFLTNINIQRTSYILFKRKWLIGVEITTTQVRFSTLRYIFWMCLTKLYACVHVFICQRMSYTI